MCVGFWTTKHPDYALILLNNRDEFLSRPTKPASVHHFGQKYDEEGGEIISGLDTKGGGTWLGINRHGRIAMLTNITEEARKRNTSRGDLVSSFLLSSTKRTMNEYIDDLIGLESLTEEERLTHRNYAGFNLLLISLAAEDAEAPSTSRSRPSEKNGEEPVSPTTKGSPERGMLRRPRIALVTNSGGGGPLSARWLTDEEVNLNGVSNGIDRSTMHLWSKVKQGQEALGNVVAGKYSGEEELIEELFRILETHPSQRPTKRDDLRGALRVDPLEVKVGEGIQGFYGTRLSTIILVKRDGSVVFRERDVWKITNQGGRDDVGNGLAGPGQSGFNGAAPVLGDPKEDRELAFRLYL